MSTNTSNIDPRYKKQFLLGSKIAENPGLIFKFKPFGRKELESLNMPVLILVGDQDIINKKSIVEKASESISGAETSVIPDAGHFLTMDQIEITNNRISEFMNSSEAISAAGF
jgi:pimeloyl-ACP methyl ester carboxylesterase